MDRRHELLHHLRPGAPHPGRDMASATSFRDARHPDVRRSLRDPTRADRDVRGPPVVGLVVMFGLVLALGAMVAISWRAAIWWLAAFALSVVYAAVNLIATGILTVAGLAYFVRQRDRYQKQSDDLLHNILPDEIAARLKDRGMMIADEVPSASGAVR